MDDIFGALVFFGSIYLLGTLIKTINRNYGDDSEE